MPTEVFWMSTNNLKTFSLKFIDIMIGIILGLGFQWWPNLHEPWQYIAFVFVYLDIVDYWIDYSPGLKKFPPHHELELMIDVALLFMMFLIIYSTQLILPSLLLAFAIFRAIDVIWLWRALREYHPSSTDRLFVDTWIRFDMIEVVCALVLIVVAHRNLASPLALLLVFIAVRVITRIVASFTYKKWHLA